uniref:GPS domain-containing protein n=1 Tax=Ditylenchus dipsaci TaxID=166011 RepID=A0A915ER44_9BILA
MIGGGDEPTLNYTCAYYDENEHTWSITGINVLSRNFENGFVLCETTHLSVFSLFRAKYTDPALITFLLTILLVHLVHFTVLITPHFSIALLNSAIHTRIAAIELDTLKGLSHWSRLVQVFTVAIVIPICLCITTWLLDGYVFYGGTTRNPTLLAFNWTFTATFLIPIVIFVGCAIGYGCYCLCYGNSLAKQQGQNSSHILIDLANAAGLSLLLILLFYSEALVFYQRSNVTKSLILAMLHLSLSLAVFLFAGYLYRIELKFPRFSTHHFNNTNTTSDSQNPHRNGHSGAFTAVHTEIYEEPIQQKHYKANGNGLSHKVITSNTNGYHNPHSPAEPDNLNDANLDRKILLDHCHPPSVLASAPSLNEPSNSGLGTTL